eukprot:TRINITY_DN18481_c0_g1_i1.p1 TRINITY_DN18481_c0_g1~~TRINITY_DN18481_c0_g1_i1.p1  ORF type:complete len:273 (-),score=85.26 TRINITY_DN18481_c0_g1_i1:324-1142(-)
MFDCSCKNTCSPSDPATTTVKIDPALLAAASGKLIERWEASGGRFVEVYEEKTGGERLKFGGVSDAQQESKLAKEWDQEKKRREVDRQREAERVAARAEEARLAREREEQEVLERERLEAEENARLEQEAMETARRAREEASKAKEKAERERLEREAQLAEEKARQLAIANFLKLNGFPGKDVNAPKKVSEACGLPFTSKTVYPIHVAAETGDATLLKLLIQERADPAQKTSGGKTAVELAQKKSKAGSHEAVLAILGAARSGTSGGYAGAK